jgi:hypothetical protein
MFDTFVEGAEVAPGESVDGDVVESRGGAVGDGAVVEAVTVTVRSTGSAGAAPVAIAIRTVTLNVGIPGGKCISSVDSAGASTSHCPAELAFKKVPSALS